MGSRRLGALAVAVFLCVGAFAAHAWAGDVSAARSYTLRVGDLVRIPAIGQACRVIAEGGAVDLSCSRPRGAQHEVSIFRDQILVWKVGNPDRPAWTGAP